MSSGELKNPLNCNFSDIDGYGQSSPFCGLFGGLIGEIYLFLRVLKEMSKEEKWKNYLTLFNYDENKLAELK